MRKLATPTDLKTELRGILAATEQGQPSRTAIASQLRDLAVRVAADDDAEHPDLPVKKGEWTLWVTKGRATRWGYTLHNPHGGSNGSSSHASAKAAFAAGTSRVKWDGAEKLYVVVAKWDADKEKYVVSKQQWVDIPDQGEKGHGVPLPVPKLASDMEARVARRFAS
jgi:hypothetical protein